MITDMTSPRLARIATTSTAAALFAVALTSPASATVTPAGAGEWDYLGSSSVYEVNGQFYSSVFKSHGGNVKVCWTSKSSGTYQFGLYEDDESNFDDRIGTSRNQVAGGCEEWNVSGYTDGDNGLAEVYAVTNDPRITKVEFWD
ncbi:hypothetical protein [Streptomyces sp. CNQ431]|uniref:hypothetical protein n=1 Tax=Streptomyces sp. CNQ431 TaxID=1571532 RepID=UPI000689F2C0|nr:hypothetical protein [Streptomyces sp. CNQ431]